jgi:hypothetical protein
VEPRGLLSAPLLKHSWKYMGAAKCVGEIHTTDQDARISSYSQLAAPLSLSLNLSVPFLEHNREYHWPVVTLDIPLLLNSCYMQYRGKY